MLSRVSRRFFSLAGGRASSCQCSAQQRPQALYKHSYTVMYGETGHPPDVLQGKDVPLPVPSPNELLVRIVASPIHPAAINTIQGTYAMKPQLPCVPGYEGVGIVETVGQNVTDYKEGDHIIMSSLERGTWREHILGSSDDFIKIDKRIPFLEASTLMTNPGTAYRMLKDFETKEGDTVLQNGANSAVGQALIQIAKSMGIKTINVVRERDDFTEVADDLKDLGADMVITDAEIRKPEMKETVKKFRPKLAIDCVAGKNATELMRHLAPGGILVNYGGMSKQPIMAPVTGLIFKDIAIRGFWFSRWRQQAGRKEVEEMVQILGQMVLDDKLQAPWSDLVSIRDFKNAVTKAMTPYTNRKQVLVMDKKALGIK